MKPPPFAYEQPADVDEALALLAERGEDGKVLAGGQSLLPLLNFRLAAPACLIDVNRVGELSYVRRGGGTLRMGALTRQAFAERSRVVADGWPLVVEGLRQVAHPQIRNRGTIGGSVAHADPAAELPTVLSALAARFHVRSAAGARTLTASDMFVTHLTTALAPDELLVEIEVPPVPPRTGAAFLEFALRQGDFALAGVAATVTLDADGQCGDASVVLACAAPTPLRAAAAEATLRGRRPDAVAIREAAAAAVEGVEPPGDIHGSGRYRRRLLETLTRRALTLAARRAAPGEAGEP